MTGPAFAVPVSSLAERPRLGVAGILAASAVGFVVLQGGVTMLLPHADLTWSALIVTGVLLAILATVERVGFGRDLRAGFLALGYGRPNPPALLAAALIGGGMLAFFPLYSALTGTSFVLKSDWLWVLLGAIVLNGIAEETLFRGFVFGHLRSAGNSFRRAGLISLAIFGAVHLFLFAGNPFTIALLATLLAVAAAFPFAFLFERAGGVIWAGVVLHVAAHAIRLFDLPESQMLTVAAAWIVLQFSAVFLVFAFRNNLLRTAGRAGAEPVAAESVAS